MESTTPELASASLRPSRRRLALLACFLVVGYAPLFAFYYYFVPMEFGWLRTVGLWLFGTMWIAAVPACILEAFRRYDLSSTGLRIKSLITDRNFRWEQIDRVERGAPIWTLLFVRERPAPIGIPRFLLTSDDLARFDELLSNGVSAERHRATSFIDTLFWPNQAVRTLRGRYLRRKG